MGGEKGFPQILESLSGISKKLGCVFSFVSASPGIHSNPEIKVKETFAEKFREELKSRGMLYDPVEARAQVIEEIKANRTKGGKIELREA